MRSCVEQRFGPMWFHLGCGQPSKCPVPVCRIVSRIMPVAQLWCTDSDGWVRLLAADITRANPEEGTRLWTGSLIISMDVIARVWTYKTMRATPHYSANLSFVLNNLQYAIHIIPNEAPRKDQSSVPNRALWDFILFKMPKALPKIINVYHIYRLTLKVHYFSSFYWLLNTNIE